MLGAGDEVGERVGLAQELAVLVPVTTELTAAADVRDPEHHTAVEEADACCRERRVDRHLVRAVAVEEHRAGSLAAPVAPVHERNRYARAVGRGRPLAPALVVVGIEAGYR